MRQRSTEIDPLDHLKNFSPQLSVVNNQCLEVWGVYVLEFQHLSLNDTVENLLWRRQQSVGVVEVTENHHSARSKFLLVFPGTPVPRQPLQVLVIDEIEAIGVALAQLLIFFVTRLHVGALSILIFGAVNFELYFGLIFIKFGSRHTLEVYLTNKKLWSNRFITLPLLIFGLKHHASDAVKLLPGAVLFSVDPRPV